MDASAAIWLPIAAPLAAAALLGLPVTARLGRRWWEPVTLTALVLAAVGLVAILVTWPVVGRAVRFEIGLGPIDPAYPVASAAWSLAPVAISAIFVGAAVLARSRLLVTLALVGLGVAIGAAAFELLVTSSETGGGPALAIDPLSATLLGISVLVGGLITVFALGYEPAHLSHRGLAPGRTSTFLAWLLAFMAAMDLLVLADDLRVLLVGWELTTLCSFILIGFDRDGAAVTAARRAMVYGLTGGIALEAAVWLAGPAGRLSDLVAGAGVVGGAGSILPLVLAGCVVAAATKSALVPFHPWLLGAMVAAAPVSGLLHASAMVNAGVYLLLRLAPPIAADGLLGPIVALLGGFTFVAAAVAALREQDLKRILAFSTISTLGLIAASAGLGTPAALAAGLLILIFHAVAKALAFLSVGAIEQVTGTRDLEALVGAVRTIPRLAAPLVIAAAALALPPFGLVVAKWAIFELGARDVALIVLLAVGGAAYLALWTAVVGRLIVRRPGSGAPAQPGGPVPRREAVPIAVLSLASVAGFLLAAPVARGLADPAGRSAFGTDPGLATGWSIVLSGGSFAVPGVAALFLTAVVLAVVVGRRVSGVSPAPYLSGASLAHGPAGAFHGGLGRPRTARSGGFYWGGRMPSAVPPSTARLRGESPGSGEPQDRPTGEPPGQAGGGVFEIGGMGRIEVAIGWVLVGAVVLAGALGVAGARVLP